MSQGREQREYNPILEGVIWKQLLLYFFPILFGTMFQQLYNTADAMIVGRFIGKQALAAVAGSSGMIVMLIVGFFVGLASGATVLVSQFYGARDHGGVHRAVHTVMAFSLVCGALITVLGIGLAPAMLRWMRTPEDVMDMSVTYLRVYFAGMIGNLIYNTGSGILRAVGDSRRPFLYLVVSCVVNIVLDALFVIPLHMGIFGAALATILAQLISAVLVLRDLLRDSDCYRLEPRKLRMEREMLGRMLRIGLPAGLQASMYSISNVIIQVGMNELGTDTASAWAAYYKIDGFFWMTVSAFGIAITTFVGQNYGAGRMDRVYGSIRSCLWMSVLSALMISGTVWLICPWLLRIFITDPAVFDIGIGMMRWLTPFYVTYVSVEILAGALRGAGDTLIPMVICGVGVCLLRSLWVIVVLPGEFTMYTLMASYPASWIISSAAFYLYLYGFSRLRVWGRRKA